MHWVCLGRLESRVANWPPTHTQETCRRHQNGVLVVLRTCQPRREETRFFMSHLEHLQPGHLVGPSRL